MLAASLVLLVAFVLAIVVISRRDAARTEREQYSVYSAYLFSIPVLEKPLPVQCREDPQFTGGEGVADIRQYFVSDVTISGFSRPSVLGHVPQESRAARWVPISVFNSFVVRNLSTDTLIATRFDDAQGETPQLVKDSRNVLTTEQPTLSARFTKAGFNRDFTMAMFYAEVTCGGNSGREYVIMHKVPYGGRYWYWYVVRVDRE
ncbi:MAG: hypothetical protein WA485_27550 [Candidatus Sulfotelmatobacter sp.]